MKYKTAPCKLASAGAFMRLDIYFNFLAHALY